MSQSREPDTRSLVHWPSKQQVLQYNPHYKECASRGTVQQTFIHRAVHFV